MDRFARIQEQRDLRLARLQLGNFFVVKQNDDGRLLIVERWLNENTAARVAGAKRDSMTDADIDEGWNYLVRHRRELRLAEPELLEGSGSPSRANEYGCPGMRPVQWDGKTAQAQVTGRAAPPERRRARAT